MSVFTRDRDGTLRHFYSAHPSMAHDIRERGLDLLCPLWNVLDLTPQGRRDDWYAKLAYPTVPHWSPRFPLLASYFALGTLELRANRP